MSITVKIEYDDGTDGGVLITRTDPFLLEVESKENVALRASKLTYSALGAFKAAVTA